MIENMIELATVKRNDQRSITENHHKIKTARGAFTPTFRILKTSGPPGKERDKWYKRAPFRQ